MPKLSGPRAASCSRPTALSELRAATAGLCATLVGIGLARFAYTPLLPALIEGGWFSPPDAAYLAAANLVGYLAGAIGARPVLGRMRPTALVRLMMLVATATFFACALRLGFPWFVFWRFLSGLSGGLLMVAVAPTVLAVVRAERRGRIGGIMFAGVGHRHRRLRHPGAAAAARGPGHGLAGPGCRIPRPDPAGLDPLARRRTPAARQRRDGRVEPGWPIIAVCAVYALFALGLVPHMVFFVDFIARGLGWGVTVGAGFWVVYGVGAVCGPFIAGWLGDRIGFGRALSVALGLQLAVVLIPLLAPFTLPLAVSALVMGAFTPGMPSLILGRLAEISHRPRPARRLGPRHHRLRPGPGRRRLFHVLALRPQRRL